MKKEKLLSLVAISFLAFGVVAPITVPYTSSGIVYAQDNLNSFDDSEETTETSDTQSNNTKVDRGNSVSDELKGWKPIDSDDMQNARARSSWLTDLIGVAISFIMIILFSVIGLITALDMLYIGVPWSRGMLYTPGTDGAGGISGMNGTGKTSLLGIQWVSDEAVQVASMLGGSAQATGHGGGMSPMGGFGGGFGGGYGGVGLGAQPQQVQQNGGRSPIRAYLSKRLVFLVYLGICSVLLFSSMFTDFGINIGGFILDLLSNIMSKMSTFNFG